MWGGWYGLLTNIIFTGLCFRLLENGQIEASGKTDNDILFDADQRFFCTKSE
jgi:hypothetical protein